MLTPSVTLTFHQPSSANTLTEPEGITRLRHELADKSRRLEETLLNLDNLISPLDWLDAGDGFPGFGTWRYNRPVNRTQDRTHAPLNYLNEEEWRLHVAMARDLVTRNHLALGFRDHVSNFIGPVAISFVLKGQAPGATASGPVDADGDGEPDVDPLVRECTQAWEEWRTLAEWGEGEHDREEECRHRLIAEGECTLRFFKGDAHSDGLPYVRHVEPELIRTPPGYSTIEPWGWGVKTREDDDECEEGIWICDAANVSEGRTVESCGYVRVKSNVDRTVKRGLSDFFPVAEHLRKVLGLLDNMGHVARLQAAIAWWEQYPTATAEQVQNQIRVGADYSRLKLPPSPGGTSTEVTNYEAGTVVRTESGREVQPGPVASGVAGFAQVQSLLLRGVGFRWGCPSYFSGDADASFASVLVTGSPFVRITESRQEKVKGFARAVAMRVLEFCEKTGRVPKGASKRVRAVATARPVVIADEEKQARTFLSLYQQNCADPVEFIRKRGGDPKVVAANIAAWKKKFEPPQQGAGGMAGGMGGPSPAPPGSAGGDGSSPNAEEEIGEAIDPPEAALIEARVVRKDGDVWTVGKNKYTKQNGRIYKITGQPGATGGSSPVQSAATKSGSSGGGKGGTRKSHAAYQQAVQAKKPKKLKDRMALAKKHAKGQETPTAAEMITHALHPPETENKADRKDGFDFRVKLQDLTGKKGVLLDDSKTSNTPSAGFYDKAPERYTKAIEYRKVRRKEKQPCIPSYLVFHETGIYRVFGFNELKNVTFDRNSVVTTVGDFKKKLAQRRSKSDPLPVMKVADWPKAATGKLDEKIAKFGKLKDSVHRKIEQNSSGATKVIANNLGTLQREFDVQALDAATYHGTELAKDDPDAFKKMVKKNMSTAELKKLLAEMPKAGKK